MNSIKIISSLCCTLIVFCVTAMDESKPLDESLALYDFSSYISIKLPSFGEVSQCVANSWDSVANTVMNNVSDAAAFKKLGWPPHDPFAQKSLIRSAIIYDRVNQALLKKSLVYENSEQDYAFIDRRYEYCQRVLRVLESHPEGAQLALHCITHHKQVLRSFDIARLTLFIQLNREKSERIAQDLEVISIERHDSNKY